MRSYPKSIGDMTAEIRANNIEKGWRAATGGPGSNTLGDYLALLHSEAAEALEAYRDWRLDDATGRNPAKPDKPEGVGSELADILIRLLDTGDVFGIVVFDSHFELADVVPTGPALLHLPTTHTRSRLTNPLEGTMADFNPGDTATLESKLLFGDTQRREGTVTAVADDGHITVEFPNESMFIGGPPMQITSKAEHFVRVRRTTDQRCPNCAPGYDCERGIYTPTGGGR